MLVEVTTIRHVLWYVSIILQAGVVLRLLQLRIFSKYLAFSVFMSASVIRSLLLVWMDPRTREYAVVWIWTEPVLVIMAVAVVWQIHGLTTSRYPRFGEIGRWFLVIVALLIAGICVASVRLDAFPGWNRNPLPILTMVKRYAFTALAVFLLISECFFRWNPSLVESNINCHRRIAACYFMLPAAGYILLHRTGEALLVNILMLGGAALCHAGWAFALTAAGEQLPRPLHTLAELEHMATEHEDFMRRAPKPRLLG